MQFSGSIALIIVVTLIVGVVSGFLLLLPKIFESTVITRKLSRENKTFQEENQNDLYQNLSQETTQKQEKDKTTKTVTQDNQ